jgi:hypothetical protein
VLVLLRVVDELGRLGLWNQRRFSRTETYSGGVSTVDIDGNNAFHIKAIGAAISTFETLPPYYTVEYMQGRVKKATKQAIRQQIVEPHWDKLSPSQQEGIRSLLEEIER